jgi:hypothetical protein
VGLCFKKKKKYFKIELSISIFFFLDMVQATGKKTGVVGGMNNRLTGHWQTRAGYHVPASSWAGPY